MFTTFRKSKKLDYPFNLSITSGFLGTLCLLVIITHCTFAQSLLTEFVGTSRNSNLQSIPPKRPQLNNDRRDLALATQLVRKNTRRYDFATKIVAPRLLVDPGLSINDVTVNEGDDGILNSATFTIKLSAASQQTVSVLASTQSDTAIGDVDFGAGSLTLTIDPGKTSQTITVFVKGDSAVEGTEQFFLNLSNPVNATIADGQGVATIVDDDALILLTEANVQRAIALDSVLFTRDSFPIRNDLNFSSDHRTRVILFAVGLKLLPGDNASAVSATAEDSQGTVRTLEVEFVGKVPTTDWLTQVVLKLNDQITSVGDIKIKITLHGATSNTVLVGVKPQ